jgi:hypothetical protein
MKNIDDLALQEMVDYCMSHSLKVNGEELYQVCFKQ